MATAYQRLIEIRLGHSVEQFVDDRPEMSWRQLARALEERTGEHVAHEALRQWIKKSDERSVGVA